MFKSNIWLELENYFFSLYENSLFDLSLFIGALSLFFILRNLFMSYQVRKARNNIPLVLGGWGSRGKSGTERLKAGMMSSLGCSILSKTTGCEALFLYGNQLSETKEMFLFRPYDKATIYEQFNLLRFASMAGTEIFLWECMGLTPSYVKLLQRKWGRDTISTITNTYPDHEDLQGPAGINIPEVMTNFIPEDSTLLTTEEQMFPILVDAAHRLGTDIKLINWLHAGLIPTDILKRFPYEEHPYNIALVTALGEELGISEDRAFKTMADLVIADLGVLKTYPLANVRSRRLEYVMGMSANERYGAMSNWQRMGFDQIDLIENPDTLITTVVNNRADRISRSQIFAKILVEDVSVDKHVLIGTNLKGMVGYIKHYFDTHYDKVSLWSDQGDGYDAEYSLGVLDKVAQNLRVPSSEEHIQLFFKAMIKGVDDKADVEQLGDSNLLEAGDDQIKEILGKYSVDEYTDEILKHLNERKELLKECQQLHKAISSGSSEQKDSIQQQFKKIIWKWFSGKLVVVENVYSTGNQTVNIICENTPPGIYNRIMGMQNIKGTGLDFVYKWQAWEACYKVCEKLKSNDQLEFDNALENMNSFQDYGLLCENHVKSSVEIAGKSPWAADENKQSALKDILGNMDKSLVQIKGSLNVVQSTGRWTAFFSKFFSYLEEFVDISDAIRRRKKADKVYMDMIYERISTERAVMEIHKLNKRQKGGWFSSHCMDFVNRFSSK